MKHVVEGLPRTSILGRLPCFCFENLTVEHSRLVGGQPFTGLGACSQPSDPAVGLPGATKRKFPSQEGEVTPAACHFICAPGIRRVSWLPRQGYLGMFTVSQKQAASGSDGGRSWVVTIMA